MRQNKQQNIAWRLVMAKVNKVQQKLLSVVPEMRRIRNIYFVGIGGAGMSGIAA